MFSSWTDVTADGSVVARDFGTVTTICHSRRFNAEEKITTSD
jgi:hypothetical protein